MATVKILKADVSSVRPSSERLNEGLTLETSAFKLFTVAIYVINSTDTLNYTFILSHRRSTTVSLESYPLFSFVCQFVRFCGLVTAKTPSENILIRITVFRKPFKAE